MEKLCHLDKHSGEYLSLPLWGKWLFHLGQKVAATRKLEKKVVIGVTLPTQSYAVLFFLLGLETINASELLKVDNSDQYFDEIASSKNNDALLIFDNKRWKRCWFLGVENIRDEMCIKTNVPGAEKRKHINYITKNRIHRLRRAVDPDRKVANGQVGFEMTGFDSLKLYLGSTEKETLRYLVTKKPYFTVYGSISTIKNDIENAGLSISENGANFDVTFQHLLRFKNFMTDFDIYNGEIVSSRSEIDVPTKGDIAVYNGSVSFINNQHMNISNIEVIFLDRSDAQFSMACSTIMDKYYNRDDDINIIDKLIPNVELIAFSE